MIMCWLWNPNPTIGKSCPISVFKLIIIMIMVVVVVVVLIVIIITRQAANQERDLFIAQLYKFHEERNTPINKAPIWGGKVR